MGTWVGQRRAGRSADIAREESQTDDYLNRVYDDRRHPGRRVWLWVNYSRMGNNLRHSPAICLPSGGWSKVESECKVMSVVPTAAGSDSR